jgi:hypothetical protein
MNAMSIIRLRFYICLNNIIMFVYADSIYVQFISHV